MGLGMFGSFFVLALFLRPLVCQRINTDEPFVLEFLQKMGFNVSKDFGFSGSICSLKGVSCDTRGRSVVKLELPGLGLFGVIPDTTIGKLANLETLDLSNNNISALPSDFWSLGSLTNFNLSWNQIYGSLPSNIGNFGKLRSLDLSHNHLYGSIPEAISSLLNLQVLNLSGNGFESTIPLGILQCRFLVSVDLSENKFLGSLPIGFGTAFPNLRFLNLAENEITGRGSDFLGMKMIRYLNISGNLFKGSAVGIFEGPLEIIDLSNNQFQGHIDQVSYSSTFNWTNLQYLDLSDNQFSGEFPDLSNSRHLRHLNLAHNRFTEQRFLKVDDLTDLEYLNLSGTNLIGQIPSNNISHKSSLRILDLSKNHLSDHIPPLVIKNLKVLDLSYNNLTGDIPLVVLEELQNIERFNFSYNNLSFCASQISPETFRTSFIGSVNSCPIAANPAFFDRKSPKHRGLNLALALTLSMVCLLVALLFLAFGLRRKARIQGSVKQNSLMEEQNISGPFSFQTDSITWEADVKQATNVPVVIFEKPLLNFTFADLLSATSQFDRAALLAEGRFGPVYGGVLSGGIHVAVKVLVHGSTMTDQEAARELEYLGRIKHPNLVPLTGYCLAGDQRIAIYEYMENGNLQNLLYDLPLSVRTTEDWSTDTWEDENNAIQNVVSEGSLMTWRFRHEIALGTARALAYLHHGCFPPIIHGDVKASSVFLDSSSEPRLSDFGLVKIFGNGLDDEIASGSPGYVPPELFQQETDSPKTPTPKSDVYGFGIILFGLITGKRPVGDHYPEDKEANLVSWVRGLVRRRQEIQAIDPKIRGTGRDEQLVEAFKIGYLCTAEVPSKRPSMQQVVGLLKDLEPITAK